jgi:hypothetical protein
MSNARLRDNRPHGPHDDEDADLMNPDSWDWESIQEAGPSPDPHLMFEVRFSGDEIRKIERAAGSKRMSISEYLRFAGLQYALDKARI